MRRQMPCSLRVKTVEAHYEINSLDEAFVIQEVVVGALMEEELGRVTEFDLQY